jgi:hypothetical protein
MATVIRSAGTQHWSDAWLTGSGKAGPVDPARTRPRRGHREDARGAKTTRLAQQLLAMFTAILRASSRVSGLAAELLREWGVRNTDRRDARARIGLRPACAASGFFQCLIGYNGNEEFLFGLVEGVISSVRMVGHGNGSCPQHIPFFQVPL